MLSVIRLFLESVSEDNRRTPGPALPCDGLARRRDLSLLLDPPQMIGVSSLMIRAVSAGVRYGDACPAHVWTRAGSGCRRANVRDEGDGGTFMTAASAAHSPIAADNPQWWDLAPAGGCS